MFNNANGLSRSISQNDHSEPPFSLLKDQSSSSSLTSGIGHSDQSICNDRMSALGREDTANPSPSQSVLQADLCSPSTADGKSRHHKPAISSDKQSFQGKTQGVPKYLRDQPTAKPSGAQDSSSSSSAEGEILPAMSCERQGVEQQDATDRLRSNLKEFVDIIFTDSQSISLEKKAEFGQHMRTPEARLLFAIFVDDYRVNSKRVSELTFYSLAQYFSIVLLECLLAEDFRPAKIIMNMMFTYYYEQTLDKIPPRERSLALGQDHVANKTVITYDDDEDGCVHNFGTQNGDLLHRGEPKTVKTYLYTLLKDQEIFKSIRFWTSAFYESVIIERNNHPSLFVHKLSNEKHDEELEFSKNITFGLLGSFIHNMCLLDLSHEFCREFLNKHSTIAGLSNCQLEMLRSNLQAMFKETSSDKAPISQATAGERLSKFLQKLL